VLVLNQDATLAIPSPPRGEPLHELGVRVRLRRGHLRLPAQAQQKGQNGHKPDLDREAFLVCPGLLQLRFWCFSWPGQGAAGPAGLRAALEVLTVLTGRVRHRQPVA
jgi:hypothetical protein